MQPDLEGRLIYEANNLVSSVKSQIYDKLPGQNISLSPNFSDNTTWYHTAADLLLGGGWITVGFFGAYAALWLFTLPGRAGRHQRGE